MGSIMSGMKETMEENFKKQQEFQLNTQRLVMERQIQVQMLMREKMISQQLGGSRDMCYWFGSFYVTAAAGMLGGFARTRHVAIILPIVPLSFIMAYQLDLAFGNKMERIVAEADEILKNEPSLLKLPGGTLTFDNVEAARKKSARS
ncbi:plasminogen receptor (KT)-like [Dysidea avara]|uniref:plasminogen receptor (KT)-like n=1 Tax=Dysidea avara TaxID=196820 RepID=UPI00331F465D